MKKFITFAIFCFFVKNVSSQANSKSDTTTILKTDNYSNIKTSGRAVTYTRTVSADSSFYLGQGKQGSIKMSSFNYVEMTKKADLFFREKDFIKASELYIQAFKNNNDLGQVVHRYNTACCYAMTNQNDSAFQQLYRIAEKGGYYNYFEIQREKYLTSLHEDKRWETLVLLIKANAKKLEDEANSKLPQNK